VLTPYLNHHRPCLFAREETDARGRVRRRYLAADAMTPYERLRSLPKAERHLREGVLMADLEAEAGKRTDNEAARELLRERDRVFEGIWEESLGARGFQAHVSLE